MHRLARNVLGSRFNIDRLLAHLQRKPLGAWPKHLKMAWEILIEQKLSETDAHRVLTLSVGSAHRCACAVDRQAGMFVRSNDQQKVAKSFLRLKNCIRRSPVRLRDSLDAEICKLCQEGVVDTELVTSVIRAAKVAFLECKGGEAARTALKILAGYEHSDDNDETIALADDYADQSWEIRLAVERALVRLLARRSNRVSALGVFSCLASATKGKKLKGRRREIAPLLVAYLREVACHWREARLEPTRIFRKQEHGKEKTARHVSRFHRFADLVLTAIVEPWSRRHDGDLKSLGAQIREVHRSLPREERSGISAAPRRIDVEWLISDDHLKKALGKTVSKKR